MRTQSRFFRLTAMLAATALLVGPMMPMPAYAQAEAPAVDPPSRVGRVARLSGTVSYHGAEQTQWEPASLNFPVSSGSSFWTEPGAGAEVEAAGVRVVMDQSTQFDIDQLADHAMVGTLAQGNVTLAVHDLQPGDTYQFRTPRGTVTIATDGQYALTAGDTEHPTQVSVMRGQAQVSGDNVSLLVSSSQTAQINGAGPFQGSVGPLVSSPMLAQVAPPVMPTGDYAPPPVVAQMTGGEVTAETGRWERTVEYGQVWYPPVERSWVPYRHGHWAYVDPWGWTWIDDAPWGFAPFHYGRWAEINGAWGWIPVVPGVGVGFGYRPVYAPALVSFIGLGVGVAIGVGIGRSVGWFPLGPREAYYPPYRTSPNYVRNVNVTNVTNITNITNINNAPLPSMNRRASTVVPTTAMTGSQPIAGRVQQVPAGALSQIQPVRAAPVAPTAVTRGVTPVVASRLNLAAPAPGTAAPRPVAPGPVVRQTGQSAGVPGQGGLGQGAPVPLRSSGVPVTGGVPGASGGVAPGAAAPRAMPQVTSVGQSGAAPRPVSPGIPTGGAPGPAFAPRAPSAGGVPAPLPQLRGNGAVSGPTGGQVQAPGQVPGQAPPIQRPGQGIAPAPQLRAPGMQSGPSAPAPSAPAPLSAAPVSPALPHAAPAVPAAPRPMQPMPQTAAPMQQAAPQIQHAAPQPMAPQIQRAAPVQQAAPPVQHYAPPAPAPQPHYAAPAPAPQPHYAAPAPAPQPHYSAPAPQQHSAPAPQPQQHHSCPPNRPNC